ncbi:UDP-galactose transporter [Caenorhabditis elegans]|nr:UDP-galactose transporter [Caenorhabditis elegans]CBY25214.1 UDP-galactose transporter [Caenorhabditis elegans]|eukprot:NP_001255680.1 Nucleotide Sugar TransPorter family [Caenorhabditis elegans]
MSNEREKAAAAAVLSSTLAPTTTVSPFSNLTTTLTTVVTTASLASSKTENSVLGFIAVLIACVLSGFAGIYFEKILKGSNVSIWIRNIQLAFPSIFFAFLFASVKDNSSLYQDGPNPIEIWNNMLQGFDWAVWVTVAINAFGGLVVAVVIKYADNILKAFATSLAIVLNCIAAYFLFNFRPSILFLVGASGVIAAVFAYSMYPYKASHQALPTDAPKEVELQPVVESSKS